MTVEPPKLIWNQSLRPAPVARADGGGGRRRSARRAAEAPRLDARQSVWNIGEHEHDPEERTRLGDDRHYEQRPVC
jgi:hypothetical protein